MTKQNKRKVLVFLVLSLLALTILGSSISQVQLTEGERFSFRDEEAAAAEEEQEEEVTRDILIPPGLIQRILLWLLGGLLVFTLIIAFWFPESSQQLKKVLRYLLSIVAFVLVIRLIDWELLLNALKATEGGTPFPDAPAFIANPNAFTAFLISFVFIGWFAVVGFAAWYLWQRLRPARRIGRIAQETLDDLKAGVDLRHAIIRCYHDMCQALDKDKSLRRHRYMTPREFAARLENQGIAGPYINRLTWLFEQVRYGNQALGLREEQDAIDCLTAIVEAVEKRRQKADQLTQKPPRSTPPQLEHPLLKQNK